jgi:hypothetical protein
VRKTISIMSALLRSIGAIPEEEVASSKRYLDEKKSLGMCAAPPHFMECI